MMLALGIMRMRRGKEGRISVISLGSANYWFICRLEVKISPT
jgi:hypothetical protein